MSDSWLILESSSRAARIGLARGGRVVRATVLDDSRRHARDLASTVAEVLNEESLGPGDLAGVMVGRGPGSYTGLRVGLMSAKALAYATGCQLRAVETFAAIAEQAPAEAAALWVIADALQNQIYAQCFERMEHTWRPVGALRIVAFEVWLSQLVSGAWISGPGIKPYEGRLLPGCRLVPEMDREAHVESVFTVGSRVSPLSREALFALEPLYLRGSSAEEKAQAKERPRGATPGPV